MNCSLSEKLNFSVISESKKSKSSDGLASIKIVSCPMCVLPENRLLFKNFSQKSCEIPSLLQYTNKNMPNSTKIVCIGIWYLISQAILQRHEILP